MDSVITEQPVNWREGRRLRAWELVRKGWKQADVAAALGVTPGAVSQWVRTARQGGPQALRHRKPTGSPPKLSAGQRAQLSELLCSIKDRSYALKSYSLSLRGRVRVGVNSSTA